MQQKDYFLRMIEAFLEALNQITENIEKNEFGLAKENISKVYGIIDFPRNLIFNDTFLIIKYFEEKQLSFFKIDFLSQLFFLEYKLSTREKQKKEYLLKSIELTEFYMKKTKVYSLPEEKRILMLKNELDKIQI